jgi:hypothetical protein
MLEKLARDKHSSLLQKSVKYGQKRFYNTGSRKSFNEKSNAKLDTNNHNFHSGECN